MGDDQPVQPRALAVQEGRSRLKTVLGPGRQIDGRDPDRGEDVAIGGIAGAGQRHAVLGFEGGEEGEQEPSRGTGRDGHAVPVEIEAVALVIVQRDTAPQLGQAQRLGISDGITVERELGRIDHGLRRAAHRLSDFQMQDVAAGDRPLIGHAQHVHRDERIHAATSRDLQHHASLFPTRLS